MFSATDTSSHVGVHEVAAEAHRGSEADGVEGAVDPLPPLGQLAASAATWVGSATSSSSTSRLDVELAGRALGEREAPPRPGEHDLGPFSLRQLGHAEGERGVGEDAGDDDVLAVEETHDPPTAVGPATLPARPAPGPVDLTGHQARLAGQGPRLGSGDAHRHPWWHRTGRQRARGPAGLRRLRGRDRVALEVPGHGGARRADREVAGPRAWPSRPADNEGAASADLVVIATPWDAAAPPPRRCRRAAAGQGRGLHGQRPGQGRPRVPAARPAPRLGRRQRPGRGAPMPRSPPPSTTCRPRSSATSTQPIESDVLICSDHPEATEAVSEIVHKIPTAPARRRRAVERDADRGVHRRAAAAQRPLQDAGRGEVHRHRPEPDPSRRAGQRAPATRPRR